VIIIARPPFRSLHRASARHWVVPSVASPNRGSYPSPGLLGRRRRGPQREAPPLRVFPRGAGACAARICPRPPGDGGRQVFCAALSAREFARFWAVPAGSLVHMPTPAVRGPGGVGRL
jgi:hypothetical protein